MKKTILITLFTLFINNSFSQEYLISKYEKENNNVENLYHLFNAKSSDIIVNLNDFQVLVFSENTAILYKKINQSIFEYAKIKFDNDIIDGWFNKISKLNPEQVKFSLVEVQDGAEYSMKIYKENKMLELYANSPQVDIENKVSFYEQKETFLNIYNNLRLLFQDSNFNKLKNASSVYIQIEKNDEKDKQSINNKDIKKGREIFLMGNGNLILYTDNLLVSKNELKEKLIVSYKALKMYSKSEMKEIFNKKKQIFVITDSCMKKKIKVTQADLSIF